MAVSTATKTILCHDSKNPEVKIVDLSTGKATGALMQSKDVQKVSKVLMCLKGLFAVTRNIKCLNDDDCDQYTRYNDEYDEIIPKAAIKWDLLTDDVLWHINTKKSIYETKDCRFITSNLHETAIGFVKCGFYSAFDWTNNLYSYIMWRPTTIMLNGDVKGKHYLLPPVECYLLICFYFCLDLFSYIHSLVEPISVATNLQSFFPIFYNLNLRCKHLLSFTYLMFMT